MIVKKSFCLAILIVSTFGWAWAAESGDSPDPKGDVFSIRFTPGASFPVGSDVSEYLNIGLNGDLIADFTIPGISPFYLTVSAGYSFIPIDTTADGLFLNMINGAAGCSVDWKLAPKLQLGGSLRGGYTYGFIPDPDNLLGALVIDPASSGHTWNIAAGGSIKLRLYDGFSLGIDAGYRYFGGLYSDLTLSLGLTYHHRPRSERLNYLGPVHPPLDYLELNQVEFQPVFPVLYKYYDDHPIGMLKLKNTGNEAIENLSVSFYVKEYMDNPKQSEMIGALNPEESIDVDLFALFTQNVLTITEATKVSANIIVDSESGGENYANEYTETIRLYDRNSISWEDDRRAAAFVTLKDPTVLMFSRHVSGTTRDLASRSLNRQMLVALAMLESMKLYDLTYVIDPASPYQDLSRDTTATDYLQFPVQTLEYGTGDCDDLSIIYCALLESVGVETAFLTVPGHIFTAVNLNTPRREAERNFNRPEDLIFIEEETWLPVEVTLLRGGFLTAWEQGAKQWREYSSSGQADLHRVRTAWDLYEPVGFSSEAADISLPDEEDIAENYITEVNRFVDRELYARESHYEQRIQQSDGAPADINRLGVLFARYGRNDQAKEQFNRVLQESDYGPALMNMGNLLFLEEDSFGALEYYERANSLVEGNPRIIASLARVHHELENYSYVRKYYRELKEVDPVLSEQFAYLELRQEEIARASDLTAGKDVMLWEE